MGWIRDWEFLDADQTYLLVNVHTTRNGGEGYSCHGTYPGRNLIDSKLDPKFYAALLLPPLDIAETQSDMDKFTELVRKELVPKIRGAYIAASIIPSDLDKVDVKFAVELGLSVMLDKPIVALVQPGTKIPEKLARVVERFIELDIGNPAAAADSIRKAYDEIEGKQ